jgi:hypothetical protein
VKDTHDTERLAAVVDVAVDEGVVDGGADVSVEGVARGAELL